MHELPLDRAPSDSEWESAVGELTSDDLEHLKKLAAGYRERAFEQGETSLDDRLDEVASSILLWPRDKVWAAEILQAVRGAGWGREAQPFIAKLARRGGRSRKQFRTWIVPVVVALIAVAASVGIIISLWSTLNRNAAVSPIQGPRNMETVFDTQGVRTNIQIAQSRMLIFPEATVAELSAWVTFPEHRVDLWEGTVAVLDAQGQELTKREVAFHASSEGPLQPGQGVEVFQQFDAWPFYDKVSSFRVLTTRILAEEANPKDRKEMAVQGLEALTSGYNLKVWIQDSAWTERFASKVQTLNLELENTGLKPFAALQFTLLWRDTAGKTLKTLTFRPVSAFRSALPSGARLPWVQETIFDTEVFSWPAGSEPYPVLELKEWQ